MSLDLLHLGMRRDGTAAMGDGPPLEVAQILDPVAIEKATREKGRAVASSRARQPRDPPLKDSQTVSELESRTLSVRKDVVKMSMRSNMLHAVLLMSIPIHQHSVNIRHRRPYPAATSKSTALQNQPCLKCELLPLASTALEKLNVISVTSKIKWHCPATNSKDVHKTLLNCPGCKRSAQQNEVDQNTLSTTFSHRVCKKTPSVWCLV